MSFVTFTHLGVRVECQKGESLFDVALRAGKPLSSACGARASCGLCRVKILRGEEVLVPFQESEKKHLGNVYFLTKVRLGCQAVIVGDGEVVVDSADSGSTL